MNGQRTQLYNYTEPSSIIPLLINNFLAIEIENFFPLLTLNKVLSHAFNFLNLLSREE